MVTVGGHHLRDLAAVLVDEIAGRFTGPRMNRSQRRAGAGADFAAADEVAFRNDADQLAGIVDDRETADMPLQHDVAASTMLVSGVTEMTDRVMI